MEPEKPKARLEKLRRLLAALESGEAHMGPEGRDTQREIEKLRIDIAAEEKGLSPDA